jgi:acyl dehydratase
MIYFEDLEVGQKTRYGSYHVTRAEVIEFASRYDPQPFHLDDEAAAANPIFGRIAASGWHTAGMAMRMTVDHNEATGVQGLGGAKIEDLTWVKPVYPGDTLRVESEILGLKATEKRPEMGFVRVGTSVFNQDAELVMSQIANVIYARRPA